VSAKVNQTQGTLGTPFIWGATNSWGGIRCRNFQYNQCEYADDIEPERIDEIAGMLPVAPCRLVHLVHGYCGFLEGQDRIGITPGLERIAAFSASARDGTYLPRGKREQLRRKIVPGQS